MGKELIFEIGTEEIPARFMEDAIRDLRDITERELKENLLTCKDISTYGTPRRLILSVTDLSDIQTNRLIEVVGPPKRIAFDKDGEPTNAAIGFAHAQGVDVTDLVISGGERGEFVAVRRTVNGEKTEKILKHLLPKIIKTISFRKSMRWGDGDESFVRPIRWILSIYGGKLIKFRLDGIVSGSKTQGHRFMCKKPFRVHNWNQYSSELKKRFIVFDQEERKKIIQESIEQRAREIGGIPADDKELLETISHLVEYPTVLRGTFDRDFLKLPTEVLISVMKNQQKYVPVVSTAIDDQKLLPYFIFVCGTRVKNEEVVIKGNERVIRARFQDGRFFFEEDLKTPLSSRSEKLKNMVFLSGLGTYYDKTLRMEEFVEQIGNTLGFQNTINDIKRAARISKADLTTEMVFEFPELQGIMGKYYALLSGENNEVARAIEEQYMPVAREGTLPASKYGSIISIADKVDNITANFITGHIPTGTSDPYALRRQAIAIINIILYQEFHLSLKEIYDLSLNLFRNQQKIKNTSKIDENLHEILDFMVERFRNLMLSEGNPNDVVDSVISSECDDLVDTKYKIEALSEFRKDPGFDSLAIAFKRVFNIVKNQPRDSFNCKRLTEPAEKFLFRNYSNIMVEVETCLSEKNYIEAIVKMRGLKEAIDKYFDEVLVMDKDEEIRRNRIAMLWEIRDLFCKLADFSKINT
ncbi:MAG: glycine--tRNA ligase subunit beta [Thermodesulfobacteriota bacterium]